MAHSNTNRGLSILGIIFFGFILILILSYFHISIRGVVESPTGQDNIHYVQGTSQGFWDKYLKEPAHYLWHDIWIELFWNSFIDNMKRIKDGRATDIDEASYNLQVDPQGSRP